MKTVRFKITFDSTWAPDARERERYWVLLPDGGYFPIFKGNNGYWHQIYRPHENYKEIEDALAACLRAHYYKENTMWKQCRAKPQVFTFQDREEGHAGHTRIRVPKRRTWVQRFPTKPKQKSK